MDTRKPTGRVYVTSVPVPPLGTKEIAKHFLAGGLYRVQYRTAYYTMVPYTDYWRGDRIGRSGTLLEGSLVVFLEATSMKGTNIMDQLMWSVKCSAPTVKNGYQPIWFTLRPASLIEMLKRIPQ